MSITVGELVAYLNLEDRDFHTKLGLAERKFSRFGGTVGSIGQKIGHIGFMAATAGATALAGGLTYGLYAGIKYNAAIEQTTIAMGTMLGSTKKAKVLIGEVTKMAAATPFEFPELADATKRLVAYGIAAKDAVPLMTRLGDISSALQIPIGELSDLYGKMKVSGRIGMEDINQMAGRGIPIYKALAGVLDVNQAKIRGLVETGKVGFPDIEAAFVSMTGKGSMFGGMMDKQSRSFSGLLSTVLDSVNEIFGKVTKPLFKWLVDKGMPDLIARMPAIRKALVRAFSWLGDQLPGIMRNAKGFFVALGGAIKDNFPRLKRLATLALKVSQWAIDNQFTVAAALVVMFAPLSPTLTLITGIVAGIDYIIRHTQTSYGNQHFLEMILPGANFDNTRVPHGGGGKKGDGAALGGIFNGPSTGYPVTLHRREAVVPLESPADAARVMRQAGLAGGETHVHVYLDSEPIAARVEVRQKEKARQNIRTYGWAQ